MTARLYAPVLVASMYSTACTHETPLRDRGVDASPSIELVTADGAPADSAVVVLVHQPTDEVTIAKGTPRGQIFGIPPGRYDIHVSSPVGSSRGLVDIADQATKIRLESDCIVLAGGVTGEARRGDLVWATLFPDDGVYRGSVIDNSGSFSVCAAPGTYILEPEYGLVAPRIFTSIPTETTPILDITTISSAKAPFSDDATDARTSLSPTVPSGAVVIALGESNHGTAEFATSRISDAISLAQADEPMTILLEASYSDTAELERYVLGEDEDVRAAVAKLGMWIWDSEEFVAAMELLRATNAVRAEHARIRIRGFDVQTSATACATLLSTGDKHLDNARSELTSCAGGAPIEPSKSAALRTQLEELSTNANDAEVRIVAAQLVHHIDLMRRPEPLASARFRDWAMGDMVLRIRKERSARIVLLAHNNHVSKSGTDGVASAGTILAKELGSEYFAVAYLTFQGSARAWDSERKIGVVDHKLSISPTYSVESTLLALTERGSERFYFPVRGETRLAEWLASPHYVREFGSIYPGARSEFVLRNIGASYDLISLTTTTRAARPTPTGVRRADQ